ncbi:hypothetical protein ARMA_0099 [Ardenticatena maritima]|uniref:CRISPR-associated helicase Cas3 n=1 Tax=Ardenticatena maritima TaxID=872965 RepID=A0A0M8K741_9CHLR|nr:DEAD/DEAH box helicase [Ardenticatena maritima]KPL87620.1 hypothetical protein SE16_08315 [Ardenticatena maritima]GAP61676.1 hypothetical protein ARMA_0099 [Ardenticatena maritima]
MKLYPYQIQVAQLLRNGTSVLLQAPTGAGKTLAALWPFLEAWDRDDPEMFPRQAIYTVPMRVLANQFLTETRRLVQRLRTPTLPHITIQTGEQPLDPEFRGDIIFTTLDQTLSSLLGVPYSLSTTRSNLNVGAVLGSYLVFDEFHLFPYEASLTVLQLLRQIGRITPFVLMTATFSSTLLQQIATLLRDSGVTVETVVVSPEEARAIATRDQQKERRFYIADTPLIDLENGTHQAQNILGHHHQRSLVVVNTVGRAQSMYEALLNAGAQGIPFSSLVTDEEYEEALRASLQKEEKGQKTSENPWLPLVERVREHLLQHAEAPWVMLLHSRFESKHRRFKEELLRMLWGPKSTEAQQPSIIVIATQVVEVGLDISAEVLHTESAPAAAVLQRAGRCARYPGEKGRVYVYPAPPQANGMPNFKPYDQTTVERETCERSWAALQKYHGQVVDFPEEQAIIDEAHTKQDEALLNDIDQKEGEIWRGICDALDLGITATRTQLIRNTISSRTIIVYDAPDESEEPPFGREGFSIHIGSLHASLGELRTLQNTLGLEWALRRLEVREGKDDNEALYFWLPVNTNEDLQGAFFLAVHPHLAAYDAERGFRLGVASNGNYESSITFRPLREQPDYGAYQLECYHEHIEGMVKVLKMGPWEKRFAWSARRLAEVLGISKEAVWQMLYLTIALHDVGKLQKDWQKWAWIYQKRIGQPLYENHCLVAHTWSDGSETHKQIARSVRPKRPPHAAEGAVASWPLLYQQLDNSQGRGWLARIVCTAIARHHAARASNVSPFCMHPRAPQAVHTAMKAIGKWGESVDETKLLLRHSAPRLEDYLIDPPDERASDDVWWDWWAYFLLVRTLRLTDGLSQERR